MLLYIYYAYSTWVIDDLVDFSPCATCSFKFYMTVVASLI